VAKKNLAMSVPNATHHSIYDKVLEDDEQKDEDRQMDLAKDKLTLIECIIALLIALACVSLYAIFLVEEIRYIVDEKKG
jgi:Ca2+:H+ antiporter